MPTQNVGIEKPKIEPAIIVLLIFDFGFSLHSPLKTKSLRTVWVS